MAKETQGSQGVCEGWWEVWKEVRTPELIGGMIRGVGGVRKSKDQSWLAKGLGLGLLCWGFKRVQEEIPSEEANTLQIGSVVFPQGQCTSPQLHPCHRVFDQDGPQDSSSPVMWKLRRRKRLWRRSLTRSHKRPSVGPSRICWNGTTMHWRWSRLLRRGLEFHVCALNKSAHTKNVWKLF